MAIIPLTVSPWISPEPGFWSGSTGGTYLGCVESVGDRFRARDAQGSWLGDFPSLQIASSRIEGALGRLPVS
jgi:hypothetical protein